MPKHSSGPNKGQVLGFTLNFLYSCFILYDPDGTDDPQPVNLTSMKRAADVRTCMAQERLQQLGKPWQLGAGPDKQQVRCCAVASPS